jgi:hypothetical protein
LPPLGSSSSDEGVSVVSSPHLMNFQMRPCIVYSNNKGRYQNIFEPGKLWLIFLNHFKIGALLICVINTWMLLLGLPWETQCNDRAVGKNVELAGYGNHYFIKWDYTLPSVSFIKKSVSAGSCMADCKHPPLTL